MAIPANGSGSAVPLALYPPGFDLSGFTILDPVTGESVSGNGYSVSPSLMSSAQDDEIQPLDASPNGLNSSITNTGFYRVVRDGVHIYGLTNGAVLSGTMQFPIEFALGSTDQIVGVTFYDENNSPIIGASAQGSGNLWTLTWNTPMAFNGNYNMYAEIDYASDTPVVSVPVTVTVNNVISFPNYASQVFGNQMWIFAQTIPNAAYQIDLYDENTNYLGSFMDYADGGGYISFIWDLTDGNGHTFDSTNFSGVFTVDTSSLSSMSSSMSANSLNASSPSFQTASVAKKTLGSTVRANGVRANGATPNAGSSSASANQLWVREPAWSPGNSWAIAYSPLNPNDSVSTYRIQEMMIGGDGGLYGGVVSTLGDYGLGAPMSPGNVSQSSAFEMADTNSRAQFLSYLPGNYPLEKAGFVTLVRGTKESGRGAKPFAVQPTEKLQKEILTPLLEQLDKQTSSDLRPLLRKSMQEILDELKAADTHTRGLALEALAFKLMRLLDMDYVATRLRGSVTGGAEVDLIFQSSRLIFSRWQVQCKNTSRVNLEDVAKEVGLTHLLKSNVIVVVSTGEIGASARGFANKVMGDTNLCLVLVNGDDLLAIEKNPPTIVDVFNREAAQAMRLKTLEF